MFIEDILTDIFPLMNIGIIRKAIMIAMQFSVHLELHIRHWEENNENDRRKETDRRVCGNS